MSQMETTAATEQGGEQMDTAPERPLEGLLVVDLSQFLSGPYCSLRLSDLGARVISTAGSEEKRTFAKSLGAEEVLDHHDPNWAKEELQPGIRLTWVQLSVRVVAWFEFSLDREEHLGSLVREPGWASGGQADGRA